MRQFIIYLFVFSICTHSSFAQTPKLSCAAINDITLELYNTKDLYTCVEYMKAARAQAKKDYGDQDSSYAEYTTSLAFFYDNLGQFKAAEPLYIEAKNIQAKLFGKESIHYVASLSNLAILYSSIGNFELAEPMLIEATAIDAKIFGKNHPDYSISLNGLAVLYLDMGNYAQAEPLIIEALTIQAKTNGKNHAGYATMLNNLAELYSMTGRYSEAEPLYLESKEIAARTAGKISADYARGLNNLAILYVKTGDYKAAEAMHLESVAVNGKANKEHPEYAKSLNNLAFLYGIIGKYEQAEQLYLETNNIRAKVLGKENPHYSNGMNNLAVLYQKMNRLDTAFQYCIAGIAANSAQIDENFTDLENLDKYEYYSKKYINNSIRGLLVILKAQYEQTKDNNKLELYYQVLQAGMRLNEQIRNSLSSEEDKLRILKENMSLANDGIEAALLFEKETYTKEALRFAELNKSILLADAVKGNRARALGDLPDSLSEKEIALQTTWNDLKKQEYEATDPTIKKQVNQSLIDLNLKVTAFLKSLKNKYPKYHALKYENIIPKASEIQALLDKKTALLEYFITDSITYLFVVTKTAVKLYPIRIQYSAIKEKIKTLRNSLSNYTHILKKEDEAYRDYTETAHWLYKELISIGLSNSNIKNLILVTDGELGHLPFEIFLVEPAMNQTVQYKNLHYLIQDYTISYNYSATLFAESKQGVRNNNNSQILACASSYAPADSSLTNLRLPYFNRIRANLRPLPATQEEITELSQNFQGIFLRGDSTNERFFKENAASYSVIHLAMHGILDAKQPMLSSLAFTENRDSVEDNFLQAYEIARMKLNADLVVLSACETGYGKFTQGEGVMSLARSFMYAGVPSMLVSLWQVNDHSTAKIMKNFYQNLADGLPKDEALRQAKLDYIKDTDGVLAHPAFWSPFILMGNTDSITLGRTRGFTPTWIIIGIGLAVLGGIAFTIRRRKKE